VVMANGTDQASFQERKQPVAAEQEAGWVQMVAIRKIMPPTGIKLQFFGRLVSSLISRLTELPISHRIGWRGISTYPVQILVRMPAVLG
jgi:hypothetical protein